MIVLYIYENVTLYFKIPEDLDMDSSYFLAENKTERYGEREKKRKNNKNEETII